MSDEELEKLDQILNDHRSRKAREAAAAKEEHAGETKWREGCVDQLREMVLPMLRQFAERLNAEKHTKAEINERFGGHLFPSATLSLTPSSARIGSPSEFTVSCAESRKIEITTRTGGEVKQSTESLGSTTRVIGDVDRNWVQEKLLAFVKAVLEAN